MHTLAHHNTNVASVKPLTKKKYYKYSTYICRISGPNLIWTQASICVNRQHRIICIQPRPGVNFINILQAALRLPDPKSTKRTVKLLVFLCFWDLRVQKRLVKCWWNWHLGSKSPTFNTQLLQTQIPKVQKIQSSHQSFLHFCDLCTYCRS
jgi:hypothetical protein